MGKVIVVTSGKGGVGKTTATANLGGGLAQIGKKVVLIDADIGLRNLDLVMGLENRIVFDLVDVIEGKCRSFKQALIRDKRFTNLFLIPASQSKDKEAINSTQMQELCAKLKEDFDYIIIDCPAGIEHGFRNAIAGADEAIVVTTPEVSAVRDADRVIGLLEANQKSISRLVLNRVKKGMQRRGQMLKVEDVTEILNIELLGIIPEDESIIISANKGEPVVLDVSSKAGNAYRHIVQRLENPEIKLNYVNDNGGLMGRLRKFFSKEKAALNL